MKAQRKKRLKGPRKNQRRKQVDFDILVSFRKGTSNSKTNKPRKRKTLEHEKPNIKVEKKLKVVKSLEHENPEIKLEKKIVKSLEHEKPEIKLEKKRKFVESLTSIRATDTKEGRQKNTPVKPSAKKIRGWKGYALVPEGEIKLRELKTVVSQESNASAGGSKVLSSCCF
ncbi:hypothetical protein DFH28DRAFT_921153 [Melampsora americana]|nr:hypothetical protein DFH28DRAFT_921153 [Melampsora americana]